MLIKGWPYIISILITITGLPTRLLIKRYESDVNVDIMDFARRWYNAAQVLVLPLVILNLFISELAQRMITSGLAAEAFGPFIFWFIVVYSIFPLAAFWVLSVNTLNNNDINLKLPLCRNLKCSYDVMVRATRVLGIVIPAVFHALLETVK